MVSSDAGWIKIHRGLLAGATWKGLTGEQSRAMIGLLLQVNFEPAKWTCAKCGAVIDVPAGGTCKSVRTLAEVAGVSPSCMYRTIRRLARGNAIVKPTSARCHGTYVFKNWEKYQSTETPLKHQRNTAETPLKHIKEREEGKEGKEELLGAGKPARSKAKKQKPSPASKEAVLVLQDYYDQYGAKHGTPPLGMTWKGADLGVAKSLLKGPPEMRPQDVTPLIARYLDMTDEFVAGKGWPFYLLKSQINALTPKRTKPRVKPGNEDF